MFPKSVKHTFAVAALAATMAALRSCHLLAVSRH